MSRDILDIVGGVGGFEELEDVLGEVNEVKERSGFYRRGAIFSRLGRDGFRPKVFLGGENNLLTNKINWMRLVCE